MTADDHHSAGRVFQAGAALACLVRTEATGPSFPGLGDDAHAIGRLCGEFSEVGKLEIKRLEQLFNSVVAFLVVSAVPGHDRKV